MRNILFITNSIGFGGASKMMCFIAETLSKKGYNITIANLQATQDVTGYRRPLDEKINLIAVPDFVKNRRFKHIKFLCHIAKENQVDIVIGFTNFPNMYAKIVGTLVGIPSVMSERGDPSITNGSNIKSKVMTWLINRSSGGVFQTEGAMRYYSKRLQKKAVVIPNPIFINGEIPEVKFEERTKTVVSVGRLDNFQKRYDVMLDAFKIFSEKHPEYTLKLYGKGSDEELIKEWVCEKGLSDYVQFMGLSTNPMKDIAGDGMFLITSDYEGISNSLLEAMALGLPCVSTDHTPGGARLLISDHKNGLLAPIGDSESLAKAMCEFASDAELAKLCGEEARDVVNRFAPERIIDMWERYINSLCK